MIINSDLKIVFKPDVIQDNDLPRRVPQLVEDDVLLQVGLHRRLLDGDLDQLVGLEHPEVDGGLGQVAGLRLPSLNFNHETILGE